MAMTPVTCPGGLGVRFNSEIQTLADAAEAQTFVDARLAEGADYIKILYEDGHVFGGEAQEDPCLRRAGPAGRGGRGTG